MSDAPRMSDLAYRTGDEMRRELERVYASEDDLRRELAEAEATIAAWDERCQLLIAEKRAAVRLTRDWQARCHCAEQKVDELEGALVAIRRYAERGELAEVSGTVEALLGEAVPHA